MERFGTAHINFENIYSTRVQKLIDKNVAEFNFKLLHNILLCKLKLNSWGILASPACSFCNQVETVRKMLEDVTNVWKKLLPVLARVTLVYLKWFLEVVTSK